MTHPAQVYKDILISTIVDVSEVLDKLTSVYKDILISTIVDLHMKLN